MEDRVKEMLRDRAEDMRLEPDIPRPVVRRARHRRLLNAAVAGTTALAVVAGAVVAVGVALDARGNNPPAVSPTPSEEPSPAPPIVTREDQVPAVWPETNLDGIRVAQEQADEGHSPWRTDAAYTARVFALTVLGWGPEQALSAEVVAREEVAGWVEMEVTWTDPGRADSMARSVVLLMDQIVRHDPEGVWSVVEVYSLGLSVSAGPVSTGTPDSCPADPLTRGLEASICVTLDGYPTDATVDALIFPGDVVDITDPGQWTIGAERMEAPGGRYQDLLTEHLPPSASILLVLVRDGQGSIVGAYTERAVSGTEQPWAGLWPQDTREEAEAAQEAADAGGEGYTWQLEVEGFLEQFGEQELGWDAVSFDDSLDISDADESGPLTIFMTNCTPPEDETFCTGDQAARVTAERLLRRDRTGIWLVTEWTESEVPGTSPSSPTPALEPQDGLPPEVAAMRQAIYEAALARDHEALKGLINTEPLFEGHEGFAFSLGDVDDGRPVEDRAVEFWQSFTEPDGQDLLDVMAALVTMDYSVTTLEGSTTYSWPFLLGMTPEEIQNLTEEQRDQLRRVYSQDEIDLLIETADEVPGYIGWKLGIDEEGRWIYFIAGE